MKTLILAGALALAARDALWRQLPAWRRLSSMTDDFQTLEGLELTILSPCLNEAETIEICVEKPSAYLAGSGCQGRSAYRG